MVQQHKHKLSILNATPRTFGGPNLLHELVPQTSKQSAIDFLEHGIKRRKFSYQQLHALSNTLAQKITELTAQLENASAVIPVLLPQCPELYIVLLAILKAGKAFCPLNLDTPDERLKFILSDVSANLIVTNSAHLDRLRAVHEVQTVCADRELLNGNDTSTVALPHIDTADLAYVLYTSGSTGLPKAVSVSHRAVTQSLLAHDSHVPEFTRFLQFAAPTFDVSIFEVFFPWFRGRTLVGCLRERMLEDLPGTIEALAVDGAELTPTVIGNLLQGRASVPGLKLLLTIGEMLTQHVVKEYGSTATRQGILWAMYGPTEAAIHCTLQAHFSASFSTGNIGYPLDTVSTFVLAPSVNAEDQSDVMILPWGEEGELALGGHQLAEEYLNRPELTATAFVEHPQYGRLYRTGDRAKFCNDGTIECLGRVVTGQVKIRGQRVELGEIEQVIMKVDGCRVAVATIVDDTLVAFCATGSCKVSRAEVLQVCQQWLPAFMVPSDVLVVPNMPQLPSGKVDKRSLEAVYSEFLQSCDNYDGLDLQPDDHTALAVLRICQTSLGRRLSVHSNLAAAGLDSLRAIRIASRLREKGCNVGAIDVLASQTLYDLIRSCKTIPTATPPGHSNETERISIQEIRSRNPHLEFEDSNIEFATPCTPLQEAMLVETMSRPSAYCNWIELELTIARTFEDIHFAVSQLAQQNSILRSGFCPSSRGYENFAQITWTKLEQTQIRKVSSFYQRAYTLGDAQALLRPFEVSIQDEPDRQRILFQLHHALYDGWSFDLLLADLDKLLRGLRPAIRPQFHNISHYYVQRQKTSASDDDKTYWAHMLLDYVPTTLTNYNGKMRPNTGLQSYRTRSSIDPQRLSERARASAIDPQVFFQTAVGYILYLYTGSSDVVFGNVTSGRTLPLEGLEDIIGPCIASLPCRLDYGAFSGAHEALQKVQRLNRNSLIHCALPLRDIARVAKVQPGTRLFDVLFVWQQSLNSGKASSLAAKVIDSADELEFQLTLEFEPSDDFITFSATFDPSTIPVEQVALLSQQVDQVVKKLMDDSDCSVADLGRNFTASCLSIANPDYRLDVGHVSLSNAVETWANITPEKEAVVFGQVSEGTLEVKKTITYSNLNTRANQLAHLLSERGVGQDHLVCIMMEKSLDLYVAILAVLKLGSGYLPLVPETPVDRINTILRDAKVTLCISDSLCIRQLRRSSSGTIIDLNSTELSQYPEHNLDTPYNGSHIAYAVFTSGSTGTPKGVLVTQHNLMSNIKFLSGLYPASADSRMLQSCSQAFDVSVFEIFYAWHMGMSLCTATKEDMFRDFEASINNLGVTHLSLTPTVAALVNPANVPKVEFLVTAGEALTEHVRRQWAGRGLYQGYGPSETTNICTVRTSVTFEDLINNIGPPFDNTSAFVLDPTSDTILPRGALGELCFGGEQVFRGYLNRPELNAAKLIDIAPYGRIYRSGDMGRLLPDNCILSAGRSDDQVKIRGQRVELGEITSIVLNNDNVADCATLLLSAKSGMKSLVTFWVYRSCKSEHFVTIDGRHTKDIVWQIFDSLSRQLPAYMVPSHLVAISKVPMTAQAKIDKRLLKTTFYDLEQSALSYFAPAIAGNSDMNGHSNGTSASLSDWERGVANVLAHTLDVEVEQIHLTSSFFNLGLDSVSAIRFTYRLREAGIADFSVAEVLKNPTIASLDLLRVDKATLSKVPELLSKSLDEVFSDEQISSIRFTIESAGLEVEKIRPCTPLQEAMLASSATSEAAYSNTMILDIRGDVTRLQASWRLAQARHEILRTSFVPSNNPTFAFAQVVLRCPQLQWGQLDTLQDVQCRMDAVLQDLLLNHRPPLYLAMYATDTATKLIISCHHALYDGIAITNLLEEVQRAYLDQELPPVISFDRYLEHMISQDLPQAKEFWSTRFTNFEPTYFPDLTGRIRTGPTIFRSARRDLQTPLSLLREASQSTSTSVLSMVQAAWAKLLHYYTGEHDLCFGNVVSGRTLPEDGLDRLIAPCFNTLPVRANFDFSKSNLALTQHLHNFNIDSFAHQLIALRRIQSTVLDDGSRLFDTLVILQQPRKALDKAIWCLEEDIGEMDLPLVCEIYQDEQDDSLGVTLHYNTSLLSDKDAQIVAQTFDSSLWDLVHYIETAANDPVALPQALQAHSNMNFERLPSQSDLLHKAFEQNALIHRLDAIALDFLHSDGRRTVWSYQILDMVANHIAHRLICHAIGVEDIVPIHMEKSPMFYASILGVLKAGAAFAPVHPDLPEARKELMLDDMDPKVVLCTEHVPDLGQQISATVLCLTDLEKANLGACETPSIGNLSGSTLAYCLYTSGSTGVPKAVNVEHKAPIQTIESSRPLVPWTPSSRILQYAATTFDMCYYDCFMAWTFGFTLCAAEQHIMFDKLPEVINSLGVTILDLTPSVAASLVRQDVPGVQWLYCIGEAMSSDVAREWDGACVNSYGPTEAAFCTTMFPVSQNVKTSVIGQPYPSTSFALFPSEGQRPLPLLSMGELYIGGAQVARDYHRRADLTSERFVTRCGQRFYRTGDMVRMLSDGNFEFIGRVDDQVKIRGLRVELGEINQVLQHCDSNITSVVTQIMKKDSGAREQLVSFLATGKKLEKNEELNLRNHAIKFTKDRLPGYMVPQIYVFVDRIPKSMAGKVDKKALTGLFKAIETTQGLSNGVNASHRWTVAESHIRDVLSRLSKSPVHEVLPEVSIYQLGLDSISAVQIASALRSQGYDVSASDILRFPTCIDLAGHIEKRYQMAEPPVKPFDLQDFDRKHRPAVLHTCGLDDHLVEAVRPCTPLQQSMVSQFIARDGSVYYNYLRLQLQRSTIDITRLKEAWRRTMMRHSILRTGFALVKDEQYPFVMVQHATALAKLPWSESTDTNRQLAEEKLGHLRREALLQLHQPMWNIQLAADSQGIFLNLWMFHALFDAHSLQLIFKDVVTIYNGKTLLDAPSFDSSLDELLQLTNRQSEQTDKFWLDLGKQTVPSRIPNLTSLRLEPAPPAVITKRSSMSAFEIEQGCRARNITVQAAGIASWSNILSAYTGESSVTMGVVFSGRTSDAIVGAVLPCINTVPFPCTVTDDKMALIRSVMKLNAQLHQHQFTPLSKIQKLIGLRNESLFDSLFAFQKTTGGGHQKDLWTVEEESATTEYPVSIELELLQDGLQYRLTYLPHIVPTQQAGLILEQLDCVMKSFVTTRDNSTAEAFSDRSLYSITPAKESTLPSKVKLLHQFVEFTTDVHPDRVALEFANSLHDGQLTSSTWSYHELDAEGNKIANLLLSHNISQGSLIGVCFDKCPEASFAILGILKAGCAFVAIDPSAPSARQTFIVDDSGAQVVLSMSAQSATFKEHVKVPVLNLDKIATHDLTKSRPQLERAIDSQDRSYCLYTSGTTGTPKGCELTHENAVQALLAFQRLFVGHWDASSRWLQFASFHFDVSVLEQYWSWSVGICVVSAPRDLIFEDLANSIRILDITHIDLTPSLAQILHPDDVPSLCKGVFITGGESLKQEILDVWGPKSVIYNGYGPTEATIGCTMYPQVPANGKPSNIGPQFDNVGSYVLKPDSDVPVFRGGVGELCVSGRLVGKGYLNRPVLTKERFAYLDRFGERVYRTGDMVRILHDGTFDFLGRADDQVKLRGQRLEIGEINSVIRQSSRAFVDVATLVLKHPQQQKEQLVAFVVIGMKSPREPSVLLGEAHRLSGAKEACHENLPPYMVPTHFVPLASMPLNVNNKADGKQLNLIYASLSSNDLHQLSATSNRADDAWSEGEERLRLVVAEALDVGERAIKKDSSFYELGMDSISVIGVSRAIRQAGFMQVTPATLMRHATIGRLAKILSTSGSTTRNHDSLVAVQQAISAVQHRYRRFVARSLGVESDNVEVLAPCTPLQQGMIARYLENGEGLYFNTFNFDLKGDIDIPRLRWAWKAVFEDTQILRTVFVNTDNGHLQVVLKKLPLPWNEHGVEHSLLQGHLRKLRHDWLEANRVEQSRPFELHLISHSNHKLLLVQIFHALYDGNSIKLLFEKVLEKYDGVKAEAHEVPTFHEALPYGPLSVTENARKFWEDNLSLRIPGLLPSRVEVPVQGTIVVTRDLDSLPAFEVTRRMLGVTAQAIAQACWMQVLQEYVQVPITTGMVVSGRSLELAHADRIVGPMFNTIPYQHQLKAGDTWASAIARAHEFNTAVLPYQHTPLRDISKWCKRGPHQPLFDTLFVYQVAKDDKDWWRTNTVWELLDNDAVADYTLAIEVEQRGSDRFSVNMVTQGHFMNVKTSNDLLNRFEDALRNVLEDPSAVLTISTTPGASTSNDTKAQYSLTNGVNIANKFNWSEEAIAVREEIAALAGVEPAAISERTSIFELGLDSIDAIKLSSRLKKLGLHLTVSGIMRGLTIENMVTNIPRVQANGIDYEIKANFTHRKKQLRSYIESGAVEEGNFDEILPLTPLQEAMVADMVASDYKRYYNFDVAELAKDTDIDRLMNAWRTVVKSVPILRTAFLEVDDPKIEGSYAQVILKQDSINNYLEHYHIDTVKGCDLLTIFEDLRRAARRSMVAEPPFKVLLLETAQRRYQVLSIAHALYDGWSLGLLHDAIDAAYHGCFVPPPNHESTLASILAGSGTEATKFWNDYLIGMKPSLLPRRDRSDIATGKVYRDEAPSNTKLSDIIAFAKNCNVSLQTLGQTIFAFTLASYVGSLDVTFGCVLSGRDDDEISQLVFPTMNTVAIRTVLHGSRLEMLRYTQENFSSVKQWQHYPLRKASALAGAQGKLLDTLFIYQGSVEHKSNSRKRLYHSIEGQSDVEYPLCVEMEIVNDVLVWRCAVKEEIMDHKGAQMLLSRIDRALRNIVQSPEAPTIESSPHGTSICGLPTFEVARAHTPKDKTSKQSRPTTNTQPSRPVTQIRKALASVAQISEDSIERGMSIFHIGLDSISAIKVSSILRKQGIALSVGQMLKAGTVEMMAAVAEEQMFATNDAGDPNTVIKRALDGVDQVVMLNQAGIEMSQVDRILPLAAGQLYMVSMWLNTSGANFYPEFVYDLKGPVDFEGLQNSWQELIASTPMLRTRILKTDQSTLPYAQIVLKEARASLTYLTNPDEDTATNVMKKIVTQPWVHLFAARVASGWTLKLKIHHALYDGVSLPLLLQRLQQLCSGVKPSPYGDTVNEYVAIACAASAISRRKAFWTEYLKGFEPHCSANAEVTLTRRTEIFEPDFLDTFGLERVVRQNGISAQALFLAVYANLYTSRKETAGTQDVVIGVYLANRSIPIDNLSTATIPTVNQLPLRIQAALDTPLINLASQIQQDLQAISEPFHATTSLYEISEWTGVKVDTFVNFLHLPTPDDGESVSTEGEGVKITQKNGWQEAVGRVTPIHHNDWQVDMDLADERVNAAYLHAIDIEATIRNGKLDIGVFAPTELLGLADGKKLIGDLKAKLEVLGQA
ncbi:peptide synthetase [Stagonosporopsis vannaccii]|nr:peptide synthetase [Stagonosporopsis vannaccii]